MKHIDISKPHKVKRFTEKCTIHSGGACVHTLTENMIEC